MESEIMAQRIAAIHLIPANSALGSPIIAASISIFGEEKHRYDYVLQDWEKVTDHYGDDVFKKFIYSNVQTLVNSGAELIGANMMASRIVGRQTQHQCNATIWQNHYESHVSHYAYLYAVTNDKKQLMLKGHNFDGSTLNAANRFVAEQERSIPTMTDSPDKGLMMLEELFYKAKKLLGHDVDSPNVKILKTAAPSLATPSLPPKLPGAPGLPPLPGAPGLPPLPKM
ncbi:hypothetical protein Pondi_00066 [Escherichia phage Pondi]|nr:hypothetical protein Pondi_00066 [Escherichia phage Pondi]